MGATENIEHSLVPYTPLSPQHHLGDIVEWLIRYKKTVVPIVENQRLIGVVKESNLFANFSIWDSFQSIQVAIVMDTDCPIISINSDVSEAFILMVTANSRYVIVTDEDGNYRGILYEEECFHYFTTENLIENSSVSILMRSEFLKVSTNDTIQKVLEAMHIKRFGSALVYNGSICEGIFTDYDALKLSNSGKEVLHRTIDAFMHAPIISVLHTTSIAEAQNLIENHRIRHLLVVNDQNEPLGVVSVHDIANGIGNAYFHLLRQTITTQAEKIFTQQQRLNETAMIGNIIEAFPRSMMVAFDRYGTIFFRTNNLFKDHNCAEIGENIFDHLEQPILHLLAKEYRNNFEKCHNGCEEIFDIVIENRSYTIKSTLLPIHDHNTSPIGYLCISQDQTEKKSIERKLSLAQYSLDHSAIAVYWIDPETSTIFYANQKACDSLGYTPDELTKLGVIDIDPNFDAMRWKNHSLKLETTQSTVLLTKHRRKDGSIFPVEVHANILKYEGNTYNLAFVLDLTERQNMSRQIELANYCIDVASLSIFWADLKGKIIYMNQTACDQLGYMKAECLELSVFDIDPLTTQKIWVDNVNNLRSLKHAHFESVHRRKNGSTFPVELFVNFIEHYNEEIIVGFAHDISEKKKATEQIDYMASHDVLTGLPNRALLNARLEHSIQVCERSGKKTAVCFIDLDQFKYINDAYSHTVGDEILQETAHRLLKRVRKHDTVSRFGSDEFVIVLQALEDPKDILMILTDILSSLETQFSTSFGNILLGASIGVSIYPDDASNVDSLIQYADIAMHRAKQEGRNRIAFYTDDLMVRIHEKLHIQSLMKDSISKEEFVLYYQPQINLQTMEVVGFEALVRWQHPRLGFISPDKFIDAAEENKLIIPLGEWILFEACHQMSQWLKSGLFLGTIAINASGVQLEHSDFLSTITKAMTISNLPSQHLEIEITESSLMNNPAKWLEVLHGIDALGVNLAIDDFGTGYSSLSYLRQMPVDVLKIDQSFVFDLPSDVDACVIAESITGLAKNMKMSSLAEGIETMEQMLFLQQIGCDIGQGYLFGKPMSAKDAEIFLQQWEAKNFLKMSLNYHI